MTVPTVASLGAALPRPAHHSQTQRTARHSAAETICDRQWKTASDAAERAGEELTLSGIIPDKLRMGDSRLPLQAAVSLDAEEDRDL
jgi:hypothetical protein